MYSAIVRNITKIIGAGSLLLILVGVVLIADSRHDQRLGDRLADTLIIRAEPHRPKEHVVCIRWQREIHHKIFDIKFRTSGCCGVEVAPVVVSSVTPSQPVVDPDIVT